MEDKNISYDKNNWIWKGKQPSIKEDFKKNWNTINTGRKKTKCETFFIEENIGTMFCKNIHELQKKFYTRFISFHKSTGKNPVTREIYTCF